MIINCCRILNANSLSRQNINFESSNCDTRNRITASNNPQTIKCDQQLFNIFKVIQLFTIFAVMESMPKLTDGYYNTVLKSRATLIFLDSFWYWLLCWSINKQMTSVYNQILLICCRQERCFDKRPSIQTRWRAGSVCIHRSPSVRRT